MLMLSPQTMLLTALLIVAVWADHRHHRIPNWLTGTTLIVGLLSQTASFGLAGLGTALTGALVGLALFIIPYLMRAMAAGDVKLMSAVGAFLGPQTVAVAAAVSLVAGAVIGLALVSYQVRRHVPDAGGSVLAMRFPYASAIAIGTYVSVGGTWTL